MVVSRSIERNDNIAKMKHLFHDDITVELKHSKGTAHWKPFRVRTLETTRGFLHESSNLRLKFYVSDISRRERDQVLVSPERESQKTGVRVR